MSCLQIFKYGTWLDSQINFNGKFAFGEVDFVTTRKRSSCAISILEWAGGTVLGERSRRNDYRRKILASPSAAVHSSPGQTSTLSTFMGKDSLGSFLFLSPNNFSSSCGASFKQPEESFMETMSPSKWKASKLLGAIFDKKYGDMLYD